MKGWRTLYYTTTALSTAVGLWHFFVPTMFHWYDYLPKQYENLIVGIDYTNYCFSALLFGGSLLLMFWGKRAFAQNNESKELYFFYVVIPFSKLLKSLARQDFWGTRSRPAPRLGSIL